MRALFLSLILSLAGTGLCHAQSSADTNRLTAVIIKRHIPATWLLDGPPTFRETLLLATNGYCAVATSGVAGSMIATNQYSGTWRARDEMVVMTLTRSSDKSVKMPLVTTNYVLRLTTEDLIVSDVSGTSVSHFRKLK